MNSSKSFQFIVSTLRSGLVLLKHAFNQYKLQKQLKHEERIKYTTGSLDFGILSLPGSVPAAGTYLPFFIKQKRTEYVRPAGTYVIRSRATITVRSKSQLIVVCRQQQQQQTRPGPRPGTSSPSLP